MPIGEIAEELFGGALRIIGRVLAEVVFEICIKGIGYLFCRPFSRSGKHDGGQVFHCHISISLIHASMATPLRIER